MPKKIKGKPLTTESAFGPPPTVAETRELQGHGGELKRAKKLNPSTVLEARKRARAEQTVTENTGKTVVHPNTLKATEPYRWKPGQSGNPYGRPRSSTDMKKKFTELTDLATEIIAMKAQLQHMRLAKALEIVADPKASIEDFELACSIIEATSMDAVTAILERGHGKALQKVEVDDKRDFDDLTPEEFDEVLISLGAKVMTKLKARREARITHEGQRQPADAQRPRASRNGTKAAPGGG